MWLNIFFFWFIKKFRSFLFQYTINHCFIKSKLKTEGKTERKKGEKNKERDKYSDNILLKIQATIDDFFVYYPFHCNISVIPFLRADYILTLLLLISLDSYPPPLKAWILTIKYGSINVYFCVFFSFFFSLTKKIESITD